MIKRVLVITLLISLLAPNLAYAATFNPNYIISDLDLVNADSMSVTRIQKFLDTHGSLGSYSTLDPWGNTKSSAQIIYDAGKYWRINSQYLIVRMQIEQSLITDPTLSQNQIDWATGYGCPDSGKKYDEFKGFFNQVNWAARILTSSELNQQGNPMGYLPHIAKLGYSISGWGPSITKNITDSFGTFEITPVNNATAALYTYTPHVYNANYNIWRFWNQWFTKHYPDGSLLQVQGQPGVFLIQYGRKRPFFSKAALISRFDTKKIIIVSKNDLDAYETGSPIKFPNFSLLRSPADKIYLIDNDQKRYIESREVFRQIGFNLDEVIDVTDQDLSYYTDGQTISLKSVYPIGALLQSRQTGGISYVENGMRHSIMSKEILKSRFPNKKWITADQTSIEQYQIGEPVKFKDGDLITYRGAKSVYVISNGQRRPIASKAVFDSLGYQWSNVIWTTERAVLIHEEGEKIDITL